MALDGVQRSPRYPGGVALRFARVRRYRPDKSPPTPTASTVQALLLRRRGRRRAVAGGLHLACRTPFQRAPVMATLRFSFGTMGSGKSTVALQIHHNLASRELYGLLLTSLDREGQQVSSRLGVAAPAIDVERRSTSTRSPSPTGRSTTSCATRRSSTPGAVRAARPRRRRPRGRRVRLRADHRLPRRLFEGTKRLLELADERNPLQVEARCWCGARATHNARVVNGDVVFEGETVMVGDTADPTTAVIVATARSPIGRANKGSLVDLRPDDLAAQIVTALLAKVPSSTRPPSRTSSWAAASRRVRPGFNIARVVAILAGLDDVPGVTVNRYCSSSLQTIRMAAHAIKAGEGDVFVAGGVETVSRFGRRRFSDTAPPTRCSSRPASAPLERRRRRPAAVVAAGGPPRHLHRDGPDRRERRRVRGRAASRDGRVRQALPGPRRRQRRERLLRRRDHAGHVARRHRRRQGRRPRGGHHARGAGRPQAGVPPRRRGDRRQRLPAQRRARGGGRDERHQGQRARHHAARPHRGVGRVRRSTRRSWASARSRPAARRSPGPARRSTTSTSSRSTRRSPPRCSRRPSTSASTGTSSTSTAGRSPSATRSG